MGGNQNISILMLFDCVRVNTGLGFHWICNTEEKGGVYVNWWVNKARVTKLGLVYACWSFLIGEHMSIWMSPFCFESSCARDGGMWGVILHRRRGPYLVVGVWEILFTMSHTATRGSSWPYMDFNFFFGDVSSGGGWGYALV